MIFGKHINVYYKKYWLKLFFGVLALIFVDYIQLYVPQLYRTVVNGLNGVIAFDMEILLKEICLPLMLIIVGMVLGRFCWRICLVGVSMDVEGDLRARMFSHCKTLSQQFYHSNKVGDLMSLFTNDLETIQDCFGWGILMTCDASFLGFLALFKMFRMNAGLAGLTLIPLSLLMIEGIVLEAVLEKRWDRRQAAFSSLSDFSQESFAGIAVIKAFVKERKELHAFAKFNRENEDANVKFVRLGALFDSGVMLMVELVVCTILGYGGYLVAKGTFNAGQLVEFLGYFIATIWPVMAVSELIQMRSRGKASLSRVGKLLEEKQDIVDREGAEDVALQGEIEFRHLTFSYPGVERKSLEDVSLVIHKGENIGIIGKTGCGKTTLVDLLLRTYNVPDGTVFLDGKDINSLTVASVRRGMAYVPQDNFLFSDTIENNIAFATDDAKPEKVLSASLLADVDGNIAQFPEGYQTVLGERGVTVSGGQKQRISLARALMKNAPILILDDTVSAVDASTEKTILQNLRETRKGMTTLLIAHRVSTVEQMDKVLFMENNRVLAFGRHEELLSTCLAYRKMVELQKLVGEEGSSRE